jgi:hypothetical protein
MTISRTCFFVNNYFSKSENNFYRPQTRMNTSSADATIFVTPRKWSLPNRQNSREHSGRERDALAVE